jgi:hypothetical protein
MTRLGVQNNSSQKIVDSIALMVVPTHDRFMKVCRGWLICQAKNVVQRTIGVGRVSGSLATSD